MRDHNQLQQLLRRQLADLGNKYHVAQIGIFGSYARGEQGPDSDLDLLITFSEPVGLITFLELEQHLEQVLGVKVDLTTKAALKPNIGERILKEVKYVH